LEYNFAEIERYLQILRILLCKEGRMERKWTGTMFWICVLLLALSGCGGRSAEEKEDGGDTQLSDLPATGLGIRQAENFDIQFLADNVKLLTDSAGRELLLVPDGSAAPAEYKDASQVTTPVKRAMFTSTTQVGFLSALEEAGVYDSIAAVTTEASQWSTPEMSERFASGQITYIAEDSWTAGNVESIVAAAPDLVFADMSSEAGAALCTVLDGLGIPYVAASENRDASSEAYLEWLKFYGAFYNLDQKADDLYAGKVDELEELYRKAASIPDSERPVVAFGMASGGIVYTQGGRSAIARQLERAGAVYALQDLEGSGPVQFGMEEFLDQCGDADILIYDSLPAYMPGTLLDVDPLFAECRAYQNQRVYTLDNGYYMNSAKVVERFEDLLAICHPELEEGRQLTMYQPLQNY